MKEAFDKELDSLLRRHVRAGAEARAGGNGERAAAHLDADELSAFAEGALPPPARLAAVSHLADCEECRGHVVSLSRAAGMEAELEKRAASTQTEQAKHARRGEWLSALFAPRVLRYAAPALALCLVAAVSFIALRSRRDSAGLAQRTSSAGARRNEAARPEYDAGGAQSVSNANVTVTANTNANTSISEEPEEQATARGSASRAGSTAKGPNAEGEAPAGAAGVDSKVAESAPATVAQNGPPAAQPPPKSIAADAPAEVAKTEDKEKTENKEKKDERPAASAEEVVVNNDQTQQARQRANQRGLEPTAPDGSRNQTRSANNAQGGLTNSGGRAADSLAAAPREERDRAARGAGAVASRRAKADDEDARSEETRSAAGHRFRRERGAWYDVNYKPSMPSTGVHRGTESYRALVADIPEIGRVAEQLGGEVFVVVHGHAYHIR